jgi:hypothetical protein
MSAFPRIWGAIRSKTEVSDGEFSLRRSSISHTIAGTDGAISTNDGQSSATKPGQSSGACRPDKRGATNFSEGHSKAVVQEMNMKRTILAGAIATSLVLVGCTTRDQDTVAGGLVGGGLAAVSAAALGASAGWIVAAGAAGATVGALYARNRRTNECAYSNGDGTYTIRSCPT